jgi:hypothetical protein
MQQYTMLRGARRLRGRCRPVGTRHPVDRHGLSPFCCAPGHSDATSGLVGLTMLAVDERTAHQRQAKHRVICSQRTSASYHRHWSCVSLYAIIGKFGDFRIGTPPKAPAILRNADPILSSPRWSLRDRPARLTRFARESLAGCSRGVPGAQARDFDPFQGVLDFFRASGPRSQSQINAVLREYVEHVGAATPSRRKRVV